MELSWTTFVLEIINFLVLVWILKHFLYQPILDVIARRRADIDKQVQEAGDLKQQAESLKSQYEGRVDAWERERQAARDALHQELQTERNSRLEKLNEELSQARQRLQVADSRRLADAERKNELTALRQGAEFASRLLEQGAGPDTQRRLVARLIDDIAALSPEAIKAIRHQYGEIPATAVVWSALPLEQETQQALEASLTAILDPSTKLEFKQDGNLLAGLRICIGSWELGANIQDELRGFAELAANG